MYSTSQKFEHTDFCMHVFKMWCACVLYVAGFLCVYCCIKGINVSTPFVVDICSVRVTFTGIEMDRSHCSCAACGGGGGGGSSLCRDQGGAVFLFHSVVLVRTHCTRTHSVEK